MNAPSPRTALATTGIYALDSMDENTLLSTLESSLYPGAKFDSIRLIVANCRAQRLDPLTKPFHIVPMQVKQKKDKGSGHDFVWRDVVMPGIELYRTKAARTGDYAGMDSAAWGPDKTEALGGEPKLTWDADTREKVNKGQTYEKIELTYPEWCEVTVYRIVQGQPRAFHSGRVYWKESYATAGNDTSLPNAMWRKRTRGQLEKCAEALALRRAFPELGGAATAEEMQGKVIDATDASAIEGEVTGRTIEQPTSTTEAEQEPGPKGDNTAAGHASAPPAGAPSKPMADGQKKIIRAKLKNAGLTEVDLTAKFGALDSLTFGQFEAVQAWISGGGK